MQTVTAAFFYSHMLLLTTSKASGLWTIC